MDFSSCRKATDLSFSSWFCHLFWFIVAICINRIEVPVCTPLLLLLSGLDWWSWAADVKVPLQGFHMIPVRRKINVYSVSMCYTSTAWATNTNTLDSSNVRTLLHPPPLASLALSYFSVARVLSLTPPDSPLPPVFRSLDQLSVADVGWYSL